MTPCPDITRRYIPRQYPQGMYQTVHGLHHDSMSIYETRRARMRQLIDEQFDGVQARFSAAIDRQADYVSRCLRGTKRIGEDFARHVEQALALTDGWLDLPSSTETPIARPPAPAHPVIAWETPDDLPDNEFALVDRRAVKLSAGDGRMVFEEEDLPPLAFRAEFLRTKHVSRRSNLVIVYAQGDSMEPAILDGDAVLCDRGQTYILDGDVYAIDYGGNLRVKRLQKRFDGGLLIISDNSAKYPPEALSADQAHMITILGRVLWRGGSL